MKNKTFSLLILVLFTSYVFAQQSKKSNATEVNFPYILQKQEQKSITAAKHPEFGFQLPEMAGNLKFGIIAGSESKWFSDVKQLKTDSKNNQLTYRISDPLLGKGNVLFTVIPLSTTDGILIEVVGYNLPDSIKLVWAFGGSYGKILEKGEAPSLNPNYCKYNVFSVERTSFTVYYGQSMRLRVIQGVMPFSSEIRLADANQQQSPLLFFNSGKKTDAQALAATLPLESGRKEYFCIYKQNSRADYNYYMLPELFEKEISLRK